MVLLLNPPQRYIAFAVSENAGWGMKQNSWGTLEVGDWQLQFWFEVLGLVGYGQATLDNQIKQLCFDSIWIPSLLRSITGTASNTQQAPQFFS